MLSVKSAFSSPLATSAMASLCGVVTMAVPEKLQSCESVIWMSPVPGGKSTSYAVIKKEITREIALMCHLDVLVTVYSSVPSSPGLPSPCPAASA